MLLLCACILWVFASAAVAMLPMRLQYAPGITLLLMGPVLIVWVGTSTNWAAAVIALFAFLSMFRNPLIYFWARARGAHQETVE